MLVFLFRQLFKIKGLQKHFFGLHKKILLPLNLLIGQVKTITTKDQIVLKLNLEDWIQEHIYFLDSYETRETNYIRSTLKTGDTFIDIGANIGYHALIAAQTITNQGHVLAFEPFEASFQRLNEHKVLNATPWLKSEPIAISNRNGMLSLFYQEQEKNSGMVSTIAADQNIARAEVPCKRLDDYLSEHQIDRVDFIKLDIEGGEWNALQGMLSTLKKHLPIVMLEIDQVVISNSNHSETDLYAFFNSMGYEPFYFMENGTLSPIREKKVSKNVVFKPRLDSQTGTSL